LLCALQPICVSAQVRVTLEQLNSRQTPDYAAVYSRQRVIVQGIVSAAVFRFPDYSYLAIDDGTGGTLLGLPAPELLLEGHNPGDEIRATGTVVQRNGMVTVLPDSVETIGHKPAPPPIAASLQDLQSFRYAGRLVRTQGHVSSIEDTVSGPVLMLAAADIFWVFLPRPQGVAGAEFSFLEKGDVVEITGVAGQFSPRLPYNHGFEVLVNGPGNVIRIERSLFLPPVAIAGGLIVILLVAFLLWNRERRLRGSRERLRKTYQLAEEILGASSAEAVLKRIAETLPSILGVTRVHL
jgi:hypothetical protein